MPLVVATNSVGNSYNLVQAFGGPITNAPTVYFLTVVRRVGQLLSPGRFGWHPATASSGTGARAGELAAIGAWCRGFAVSASPVVLSIR